MLRALVRRGGLRIWEGAVSDMAENSGRHWRDIAWQLFKPALVAAIVALLVAMGVTGLRLPSEDLGVGVMGRTTFSGPVIVQGGIQSGNNITLGVGSLINTQGAVTVTDSFRGTGSLNVDGLGSFGGALSVGGDFTCGGVNTLGIVDATAAMTVAGVATYKASLTAANNITTTAALKFGTLLGGGVPALSTYITVTTNSYITPTYTLQPLTSADGVFTANVAAGVAGRLLVLWNVANTTITISDTGTIMLSAVWAGTQYDTLTLLSDGTNWLEISRSTN